MNLQRQIVVAAYIASLFTLTGCFSTSKPEPKPEPVVVQSIPRVDDQASKAAEKQIALLKAYAEGMKFGSALPKVSAEEFCHSSYSASQKAEIQTAIDQAFVKGRALVIDKWIAWQSKKVEDQVLSLATNAVTVAEKDVTAAHKMFEAAREIAWQSCVAAKLDGTLLPEVNDPVRLASVNLLATKVNPRHWPIIDREMRLIADKYSIDGKFDEGVEAITAYPHIRVYTKILDERLDAVTAELVKLHVPAMALKPLAAKARLAMELAANLADFSDEEDPEEKEVCLDKGGNPDLKQYQELLKEYRASLIMYGCTQTNADKVIDYFTKSVNELIAQLRRDPKYGKKFLKNIKRLGATAINKRIDALRKELVDTIEGRRAEQEKALEPVKELLAKGDERAALELIVKTLVGMKADSEEAKFLRKRLVNYVTMTVNPALWKKAEDEIRAKMEEFAQNGDAASGLKWLQDYPYVRTYAEEIDQRYAEVKAEAVALGVPEKVATRIIDEIAAETATLDYLADFTDTMTDVIVKPGIELGPKDLVKFEKALVASHKTLRMNNCTTANADKVIEKIRAAFKPEFEKIGQEIRKNVQVLGACALNKRLKALKSMSAAALIARCVVDKIEKPGVTADDFKAARELLRDIPLSGTDEVDLEVYGYRVGVLNSIVNPRQLGFELKAIDAKYKAFVDAGDYRGLRKWANDYVGVVDEYADIAGAIEDIRTAAIGIKVDEEDASDYAKKLSDRVKVLLQKRKGEYIGSEAKPDMTDVEKGVTKLEKAVLAQYFERTFPAKLAKALPEEVRDLLKKTRPDALTTWELNEKLRARAGEILATFKEIDKLVAQQEYLELLAAMDNEYSYDSQIAMAEDAIAKQLGIHCPEAFLNANAVLGDYARAMRLLKMKAKLDANLKVSVVLGSVYLDQPAVFDRVIKMEADVNGVSSRDPLKRSALLFAIQLGRTAFVHRLVKAGASEKAVDAAGNTAVHYAARRGNLAILNGMLKKNDVNAKNEKGETALYVASELNKAPVATALLKAKADVSIADAKGMTAMDVACKCGSSDVLDVLADAGAEYGSKQLALAADNNRLGVAQWLIGHGVDVNGEGVAAAAKCGTDTKRYLVHEGLSAKVDCKCEICVPVKAVAPEKKAAEATGTLNFKVSEVK